MSRRIRAFEDVFKGDDPQGHDRGIQDLQKLRTTCQAAMKARMGEGKTNLVDALLGQNSVSGSDLFSR